jgi:hypothetical protein
MAFRKKVYLAAGMLRQPATRRRNYPEQWSQRCELNSNITTLAIKIVDV